MTAVAANPNKIGGHRPPLQDMIIRDALEADLPAIVEIYNAAIRGRISTAQLDPVSVEEKLPWLREHSPEAYPLRVGRDRRTVRGLA